MCYQHVLLAIDYSAQHMQIAHKAQQIAKQNQAMFSIVHVVEHLVNDNDRLLQDLLAAEQNTLSGIAQRLDITPSNQWIKVGVPAKQIVELARSENVDLIVMGAHHHHGIARLLGSPSSDTLHNSPCDLLAVHLV